MKHYAQARLDSLSLGSHLKMAACVAAIAVAAIPAATALAQASGPFTVVETGRSYGQLQDAVSKIVLYENILLAKPTWHKNMLFTHDWPLGVPDNIFRVESEEAEKKAKDEAAAKREAIEGALNALKQDELFKTSLMYVSQDSTDLEFTAVSLRKSLDDEGFKKLAPIAESLTTVKIGSTSISEAALTEELPKMKNLTKLDLSQMEIGDTALDAVAQLKELEWLNLYGTKVTDAGLLKLKTLPKLSKLYLWGSKATPKGAEALKKELPQVEAFFGAN